MSQHSKSKPDQELSSTACEDFSLLITEFFEGDGGDELRTEVADHARVCPSCAEIFRSYVQMIRTCRLEPRVNTPKGMHKELWDKLAKDIAALNAYLK